MCSGSATNVMLNSTFKKALTELPPNTSAQSAAMKMTPHSITLRVSALIVEKQYLTQSKPYVSTVRFREEKRRRKD